jgi:hypothetical protein
VRASGDQVRPDEETGAGHVAAPRDHPGRHPRGEGVVLAARWHVRWHVRGPPDDLRTG